MIYLFTSVEIIIFKHNLLLLTDEILFEQTDILIVNISQSHLAEKREGK